ncbi:unnamed protein product [Brassica oleracea]
MFFPRAYEVLASTASLGIMFDLVKHSTLYIDLAKSNLVF